MSNPVLGSAVVTQAFASVVVSLPAMPGASGRTGVMAGIERIKEEARTSASQLGFADGRAAGYEDGYEEGLRLGREEARRNAEIEARLVGEALAREVGALHERVEDGWQEFLASSEQALTDRCLDTVRALLEAELQLGRESALGIVRRCLGEVSNATAIRVRVVAEDLPYLREHLRDERVELVADGSIEAGCVVESSCGTVDGTLGTSLRLLEQAWDEAA